MLFAPTPAMPITMTKEWRLKRREETARTVTEEVQEKEPRQARDGESPLA